MANLLLVEDDAMIGAAVEGALKDAAYAADWVRNGQTALSTLACQHYDLVLLDLMMPGMDGWEVLRRIRADAALQHMPVIILTAKALAQDRDYGLHVAGAQAMSNQ